MIAKSLAVVGAVVSIVTACARESARANVPQDVTGTYIYVGADTAAKIPWAARAELTLRADSTFQFELRVRVKDDNEHVTKAGTYRVTGDRMLLTGSDQKAQKTETVELQVRGDSLVMNVSWGAMAALRFFGVPQPVLVKGR